MQTSDLEQILGCTAIQNEYVDKTIDAAYTSDLLSDVMGNAPNDSVLITIQAHKNTIAVASLKDMRAIVICNSRPIPDDMIEAAKDEGLAIFKTHENQFEFSGKLYNAMRG